MAKTSFIYTSEGDNYNYLLDIQTEYKKRGVKMSLARVVDIILTKKRQADQGLTDGAEPPAPE